MYCESSNFAVGCLKLYYAIKVSGVSMIRMIKDDKSRMISTNTQKPKTSGREI